MTSNINVIKSQNGTIIHKINREKDIIILCFTDTHIDYRLTEMPFLLMGKLIDVQNPDLVIITGDAVTCDNCLPLYKKLADFFVEKKVLFSIVLGNHDGEYDKTITRKGIIDFLATYDNFILSPKEQDIYGHGNEFIKIENSDGETVNALIFVDSGDYLSKELKIEYKLDEKIHSYDTVKPNQIVWYEENTKELCKEKIIKSLMFLHIPPYEAEELLRKGVRIYGNFIEKPCNPKINVGFVDKIVELQSTKGIFYGHDHINDCNYLYKGINFVYVQSSGYATYVYNVKQNDKRGGTVINIDENGNFKIEPLILKNY